MRWFRHLIRMPLGHLEVRCFGHVPLGGGTGAESGHTREIMSLGLTTEELEEVD